MLTRADLTRLARREGIGLGRLEHEYVILCLLDTLASTPLGNTLALKGGTALRQVYFPDWRYSEDLDFSSLPPFDVTELEVAIERWFAHTEEAHGVSLRLRRFHRADGAARLRGQYRGPLEHPAAQVCRQGRSTAADELSDASYHRGSEAVLGQRPGATGRRDPTSI